MTHWLLNKRFITRARRGLLWLCLALCAVLPLAAQSAVTTAYALNPDGEWTVNEAAQAVFKPFEGPLSLGNRNIPTWIRITVPPMGADVEPRVLQVEPAYINDLRIYSPQATGWQMHQQGNRHAYSSQGRDTLNISLPITPSADAATTYYLRVHTITAMVYPQVLTQDESRMYDAQLHVLMGIYCGFALVFLLISLVAWVSTRDSVWAASALFDAVSLLYAPLHMGFVAKFVLRDSAELLPTLYVFGSVLHLLTAMFFYWQLIRALQAPRWCLWGYKACSAVAIVLLAMTLAGQLSQVLPLNNLTILANTIWAVIVIGFVRSADPLLRWSFRLMYGALTLYFFYFMLSILGIGKAGWLSLYPTLPAHFFTMAMTLLILGRRAWLNAQTRQMLEYQAREAAQRFEQEQTRHAETAGFLGMLMHEIKNPLTSIRMASELLSSGRSMEGSERERRHRNIQDAVDGIDTVLRRCLDMDRLERGVLTVENTHEDVAALTRLWLAQHSQAARLSADLPEARTVLLDVPLYVLMLSNLVDNALKYSPRDSMVTLSWREAEGMIALAVRNHTGRDGQPDPARLFTKYYRAPSAQRHSGTGLGLYWVRSVSAMLGGRVDYHADGENAVFTLSLPT